MPRIILPETVTSAGAVLAANRRCKTFRPRHLFLGSAFRCLIRVVVTALVFIVPAHADITGTAVIVDADTIIIRGTTLELYGIDAIERDQLCMHRGKPWTCGLRAATLLQEFVGSQQVNCEVIDEDLHGRQFALCRVQNLDLGAEVVLQGYAFNYPRYARYYRRQISEARQRAAGIWDSIYVDPVEWRMWKR